LDGASLAARFKLSPEAVHAKLSDSHSKLLAARASRIRPGTDDKILTAWNGLMLATIAEAARVIASEAKQSLQPDEETLDLLSKSPGASAGVASSLKTAPRNDIYYKLATRNADFLLNWLRAEGKLKRSWRDGKTTNEVFLEDYAALILGLIELYQTDFNNRWFTAARELTNEMIELFNDPNGGFFDTPRNSEELLLRPKDIQDSATPSGNALACEALLKLAAFTDDGTYRDLAERSLSQVTESALRYPTAFGRWLSAADFALGNVKQVAVLFDASQDNAEELIGVARSEYRPNMIVAASAYPLSEGAPPLLLDRPLKDGNATVYVCENFVCKMPVVSSEELEKLI
jgi:uncharacterized protein YyaL (SSP411 family)